ncbi:hypothetical protein HT585_05285 [Ensifer sp. HO-A22]|uniref:Uncharacterized protein n=1 Tax=Ensifer oleiphilus TaxID=2742698 RepID=A0A7Y6Q385_9HYPH|nr:hypothetical protein [Ensifer oleiphilus]NVD38258.1 hypothetical protein [Ensifer oleiphilus]
MHAVSTGWPTGKAPDKSSLLNHDQRAALAQAIERCPTRPASIPGAICPRPGKAAALVTPWCDAHAMNQHLVEISRHGADNAYAILIMDKAGRYASAKLVVVERMAKAPEPAIQNHVHRHVGLGAWV